MAQPSQGVTRAFVAHGCAASRHRPRIRHLGKGVPPSTYGVACPRRGFWYEARLHHAVKAAEDADKTRNVCLTLIAVPLVLLALRAPNAVTTPIAAVVIAAAWPVEVWLRRVLPARVSSIPLTTSRPPNASTKR